VSALHERGWIRRIADPSDARAWLISADQHGIAALDAWHAELVGALAPAFAHLDRDELATLARAVEIVRAQLERVRDAATTGAAA